MFLNKEKKEIYYKMTVALAVTGVIAVLIFGADNRQRLLADENGRSSVERNRPGGGKREEKLQVQIGEQKEQMTVEITEEVFSEEEIRYEFEKAGKELERRILGNNKSLDEVRSDLKLITKLPDSKIAVTWELDNYDVMNLQGELQPEALTEEGTLVRLDAFLSYKEEKAQHTFYASVFPPERSAVEQQIQRLKEEMKKLDEKTREEERMLLPAEVDGKKVIWSYVTEFRAMGILVLGVAVSLGIYLLEKQKEKEKREERIQQMEQEYPEMISRFTLFMGAGMPARKAWYKLAEGYVNREKKQEKHALYEEMVYTMHEIQSGIPESECYEKFGERCELAIYRKFGMLLSQNLKKGTKGLVFLLKQEAVNAFEERKRFARKRGEEAGTKLLMPMFLMFGMVLAVIVIPAFLSMQTG